MFFFHFSESKHCIMGVVSGFELDAKKIYRIKKIEIISSTFWSEDKYLMYLVDKEWQETQVWIPGSFFEKILVDRREGNVNIYTSRPFLHKCKMEHDCDGWFYVAIPTTWKFKNY